MAKQQTKASTFEQKLHLMIDESVSPKGDMSFELKVITWIIDGKVTGKPQLTKQQMSLGDDGSKRGGKAKGLSLSDIDKVLQNLPAVYSALGGNEAMLGQLLGQFAAPTAPEAEKAPWE